MERELRIGNLVRHIVNGEMILRKSHLAYIDKGVFEPIPITEENLKRIFGLAVGDKGYHFSLDDNWEVYACENGDHYNSGFMLFLHDGAPVFRAPCKYIHQASEPTLRFERSRA